MWHTPYTHIIQGDSQLLMLRIKLTLWVSTFISTITCVVSIQFWSCKPILNIYVLGDFQWYKELFNLMNFNPSNHFLKIWKSFEILTPKVRAHLGMCVFIPSHSPTLLGVWMWLSRCTLDPHLSMPLALVTSPRLGSWQFGKYRKQHVPLLKS